MRSLRRLAALLALAASAAVPVVALTVTQASAETDVNVSDVCSAPADGSTMRIDLLVLLDVSGSLRSNDPENLRISGTKDAIVAFDELSRQFDNADVRVAIDNFETDYSREQDWTPVAGSSITLLPRIDDIGEIPTGPTTTDYAGALEGAWSRLDERDVDCRLLIWFTDGEHHTVAPVDEVAPEEWAELGDLCESPSMQRLRDSTWVGAVRLVADDSSSETLRYLFGEAGRTCANPLRGEIYDDFDPTDLGLVLHDIIAGPIEDVIFEEDPDKLPGERDDPPTDDEYETCAGGIGTGSREQPCTFTFLLDSSHESFRAFIDLTFIAQGVRNPHLVHTVLRSPPGPSGTVVSPTIGGSGEIDPAEADGAYLPVLPFWFYTRAQYGSEIQVVGHQAAEQLTNPNQWQWQWEGEWALLFFGDTPAAQADARSVATAVRVQRDDSPFIDSFGIDDQCNVSGFVANYPSEDYPNVELQLHVDAGDGQPVYPTRVSLTGAPLDVDPGSRRFAVEGVFADLVAWDSPEEGGNGTNLRDALAQRDGIELVAVLSQTFQYAGAPAPLVWTRDIGRLELTQQQASHLLGLIDGRGANPLLCLPLDDGVRWLPTGVVLGDPQHDWGGAIFEVSADRGQLPATLSLAAEGVELVETDAAALTGVEIDTAEWDCEVPASATGPSRFTCPEPIIIEVGTDWPLRPTLSLRIPLTITESGDSAVGLLERLGYEADSAGYGARSEALAEALNRERRTEMFATELGPIIDPNAVWRASDFEMEAIDPPDAIDVKSILVSASPGQLPALADLESVRLVPESDGVSQEALSVDVSPWACTIPSSDRGGVRFPCAEPITVRVPPDRDVELSLVPTLCATVEPGAVEDLLERSGVLEGSSDFETLRTLVSEAVGRERSCAEATTPVPRTPDPIWEKLLPMLAALVGAAAAARVLIAWRLRPWQPISSPDYAVVLLDSADTNGVSVPPPDPSQICMDLQQRKSATNIEGLSLRSLWMPLLRGGEPKLRASSASGDCVGPDGYRRSRNGRAEAAIGTDLLRGWIVHDTGHDPRLIVWDLPFDDDDTRRARIIDAQRDAALAWERYRASAPAGGPTLGDSAADSAEWKPTARHVTESDPALQDPFADDSSDRSGDSGPDLDDADPFGRDS